MIPGIITAILLAAFLIGCVWVFSPRRRSEFAEAASLALDDQARPTPSESAPGADAPRAHR